MKLLACLVIAALFAVVLSQRPVYNFLRAWVDPVTQKQNWMTNRRAKKTYSLEPMSWTSQTPIPTNNLFSVATAKDLLVHTEPSTNTFTIRRRNAEGFYELVVNLTGIYIPFASTNGHWIAVMGEGIGLMRVDKNNSITDFLMAGIAGFLLSDDTYVGFNIYQANSDGSHTIETREYNEVNNTWDRIPGTEFNVSTFINWGPVVSSLRVSDTHLIIANSTSENITVEIYARQADKSWSFTESVPVNSTYSVGSVTYNDVDTFVHSIYDTMLSDNTFGIVFFYTKVNGKWIEQAFTSASVGYRAVGYLGGDVKFLDANNVLVTASFEGYDGSSSATATGGKVLLFSRNADGLWEPVLDLVGPNPGVFGTGIGINDYDIIIPSIVPASTPVLTYFTAPRCFNQPINVTCADQQVNDCSQLDVSSLYTVNNAQCGAVTASLKSVSLVNNKAVQAQFSFSKSGGFTASCNATVTCPVPPSTVVTVQPSAPSKVSGSTVVRLSQGILCLLVAVFLFV